ncbi:Outer membrane protein TolC [Cyclonatronum proteinivorum]|uniref:Outer membrane protein TolC n=1 Tax=Cyclonatronum proteinivorum TaxID=1457365 RepID=A0A345UH95_9BACT|nr:TolC family protein [Cyclonatronum proteinivorum]AXI99846.1 Outer membrane protein TolC [Cyclonatronum proteinivorum]
MARAYTLIFLISGLLLLPDLLPAQQTSAAVSATTSVSEASADSVSITLDEAIQIAMVNNYMIRRGLLDIDNANAQIREAWGAVYPQINASAQYTRNIEIPNPFAGSDAGGIFEAFGALEWLAFNEGRRTDGDPGTSPIPFDEFLERQAQGYRDAGLTPPGFDSDNPFAIENEFQFGINLTQALYNGAAFAAIRGAEQLRKINLEQVERDRQIITDQITEAFYGALLAREQYQVLDLSVERLQKTVDETRRAVQSGVLSRVDRLSAEVELVNLETDLIQLENQVELAVKNLNLILGIPVSTNLILDGSLIFDESMATLVPDVEESYQIAMQRRPDVSQVDNLIELLDVQRNISRSQYFPTVNAFANYAYIGQVPDNRQLVTQVQGQDFQFESSNRSFFDSAYWNPAFNVGISLNWNIFNGFQTQSRVQQATIERRQAQIDREMLRNAVYLEIEAAVRNLENAYRRIMSQQRNIEQAELNYEIASQRLREGLGTALEERQASSLLDQSRLNHLAAIFDYKVALSQYNTAVGLTQ